MTTLRHPVSRRALLAGAAAAALVQMADLPGWAAFLLSLLSLLSLLAAAGSVLVSLPALRLSGDHLMIASLGFQLGLIEAIKNMSFAGGSGGLSNIPPLLAGQVGAGGYAALVLLSAATAAMLGRDPVWIKVWVIALASGIAGYAGAPYAHHSASFRLNSSTCCNPPPC